MIEGREPPRSPNTTSKLPHTEKRDSVTVQTVKNRAVKRLILAVTTVTLIACQSFDQIQPQIAAVAAETEPTMLVIPSPTLTPFQPSEPTATSVSPQIIEQPVIETPQPILVEAQPTLAEQADQDPAFLEKNSYIYRNPTEIMYTPERATTVANEMLQRLIALGLVQDSGEPVTVRFEPRREGVKCETFAYKREIVCYDSDLLFQKPDASLIFHELTHLVQKGPEVSRNKELRAAMNAYILSGRDNRIYDRYLFILKYPVNGQEYIFSASNFVQAMDAQGITEQQMLQYGFDSTVWSAEMNAAMIRWVSTLSDMSGSTPFLIDSTYQGGSNFQYEIVNGIYGINPYNGDPMLTPDTQFDMCRANNYNPADIGPHCVLIR